MTNKVYAELQHNQYKNDKPTTKEIAKSYLEAVEGKGIQRDKAAKGHRLAALKKQLPLLDTELVDIRLSVEEEISKLEHEVEDTRSICQKITSLEKWLPRELEAVRKIENELAEANAKLCSRKEDYEKAKMELEQLRK